MQSAPVVIGDDMLDVLRTCCTRSTPATVGSNADTRVLSSTFSNFTRDSLTLDLHDDFGEFRVDCPCHIVFFQGQASCLITTTILEQPAPSQIIVALPNQMSMERRLSLRVPVVADMHVTVVKGEDILQAEPKGLSLSGINITFHPDNEPTFTPRECVKLQLRLDQECVELQGCVTRHTGKIYSIAFSHAASEGNIYPPDELQRMYWKLRHDNLRSQIIKPERVVSEQTVSVPVPSHQHPSV